MVMQVQTNSMIEIDAINSDHVQLYHRVARQTRRSDSDNSIIEYSCQMTWSDRDNSMHYVTSLPL